MSVCFVQRQRGVLSSCYCHIILNNANISEFEPVDVNTQKTSTFLLTFQQADLVFVLFSSSPSYRLILVLSSVNFIKTVEKP